MQFSEFFDFPADEDDLISGEGVVLPASMTPLDLRCLRRRDYLRIIYLQEEDTAVILTETPFIATLILTVFPANVVPQHAADPTQRYFRLIGLVHSTGSGKKDDPIRPEYVPTATRDGILSWSIQLTDDKKRPALEHLRVTATDILMPFPDRKTLVSQYDIASAIANGGFNSEPANYGNLVNGIASAIAKRNDDR